MIPYFEIPPLHLGPLTIAPFGVLVAVGVLTAANVTMRWAKQQGLDPQPLSDLVPWGLGGGVVVGHLVHLFLYHPEELSKSPFQVLKVWDGLSSFGGLLGGVLATVLFFRVRKVALRPYFDPLALGIAVGWGIARIGCFVAHDHPGVRTDFFLALRFPGGARHDLGLYDALLLLSLAAAIALFRRRGWLVGRRLPFLALVYGVGRFGLDFLRARDLPYVDARYLGLTPAQYACVLLVAYGAWALSRPKQVS